MWGGLPVAGIGGKGAKGGRPGPVQAPPPPKEDAARSQTITTNTHAIPDLNAYINIVEKWKNSVSFLDRDRCV